MKNIDPERQAKLEKRKKEAFRKLKGALNKKKEYLTDIRKMAERLKKISAKIAEKKRNKNS